MKPLLIGCIVLYQRMLSPLLLPRCRFYPSCSEYMRQSVSFFGSMKGLYRGAKRLLKCHPWNEGGWDPVNTH